MIHAPWLLYRGCPVGHLHIDAAAAAVALILTHSASSSQLLLRFKHLGAGLHVDAVAAEAAAQTLTRSASVRQLMLLHDSSTVEVVQGRPGVATCMSTPLLRRRADSDFHRVSKSVLFMILAPWVCAGSAQSTTCTSMPLLQQLR